MLQEGRTNEDLKIFIASSVMEFAHERLELDAYVNSLSRIYNSWELFVNLVICEDLSNAMARERKQAVYNAIIQDSQYFYILYGRNAGEYTIEELDVALKAFQTSEAPRIYTDFLQLPEVEYAEESVLYFMQRVDRALGHIYSTFTHIDSVKLILMMESCLSCP